MEVGLFQIGGLCYSPNIRKVFMAPQRSRTGLEETWRLRLEQAAKRHKIALADLQNALNDVRSGRTIPPDGSLAVRKAQLEESAALQGHIRMLRIFVDLTVYGRIPPEE